jgi:two-component system OmpR family sensor kinase
VASRSLVSRLIWLLCSSMAGLWLLGSVTAGMLTVFEINERLDNAIEEVAQRLLPATYDAVQQPQAMQQMVRQLVATTDPKALAYHFTTSRGTGSMLSLRLPTAILLRLPSLRCTAPRRYGEPSGSRSDRCYCSCRCPGF